MVRALRPPVPLEVITEENSQFSILNSQFPPNNPAEPEEENGNSKFKIQNSKFTSLQLVSVASETGATPRVQGLVRVAAGPWSLEDGWWNEKPVERDYWDIELSGGGLYRVYRDRTTGDWFADGMYD